MLPPCPFCAYAAGRFTRQLIIHEDDHALVIPSLHQKHGNRGHCLVATREHVANIYELSPSLAGPLLRSVSSTAQAVKSAFSADGVSVRQNNDPAGGQDVPHLHFHIVPRFAEDRFEGSPYEIVDEPTRLRQAEVLRGAWGQGGG